jgi:hypothetical protein
MNRSGRVRFNPTGLPGLRSPARQHHFLQAQPVGRNVGAVKGVWKGLRRVSTETGEDKSGHIVAASNEGILFFDSEFGPEFPSSFSELRIAVVE